jgi:hypothetical protein
MVTRTDRLENKTLDSRHKDNEFFDNFDFTACREGRERQEFGATSHRLKLISQNTRVFLDT